MAKKRRDYDTVYAERKSARRKASSSEALIEEYENMESRLETVKASLEAIKYDFDHEVYRKDNYIYSEKCDWKGSTYTSFTNNVSAVVNEDYTYYTNSLDYVLDTLNNEITRIENLILEEKTVLSGLWKWINNLNTELENLVN